MAPGVRKTFRKLFRSNLAKALEVFGEDEATEAIEDATEADDDECPFDADTIDGEYLDGHLVIAKAA